MLQGMAVAAVKAFPTAQGFGANSVGGRGGAVYHVTNLDDSGAGSLRACIEASGPRTCIFRVGGTIVAQTTLRVTNPYITIAGQTAPGGGILIRNALSNRQATLEVKANDVIIRHLRIRPGPSTEPTCCLDAINIWTGAKNVIIDHVSASWSVDGTLDIAAGDDITIQWSFITEPLWHSVHKKGPHALTSLFGSQAGDISFHHNLIGCGIERNPKFGSTSGISDLVNNVVYNPQGLAMHTTDTAGDQRANLVGNYLQPGPNTPDGMYSVALRTPREGHTYFIYLKGNYNPFHRTSDSQAEDLVARPGDRRYVITTPHPAPTITTTSATQAFEDVLNRAGATLPHRDAVDERIVTEVRTRTGRIIDSPNDVGGWPTIASGTPYPDADMDGMSDTWEQIHGLDPGNPDDRNGDLDGDGYTNLEEFLNQLAGDQAKGQGP
jgi:pectate lyase